MSITSLSGPLVIAGQQPSVGGVSQDYNTQAGPSPFYAGVALLDPRTGYQNGQDISTPINCFYSGSIQTIDATPSQLKANNIAAAQAAVAGTPMTLVSITGSGITVGVSIINASTGAATTVLAIDGAAGLVSFGTDGTIQAYDPSKALARNIRITTSADDTGGFYNVSGFDIYGYPMTERITGVNTGIASGKKAFKYILSVTPSGVLNSLAATVGTGDVFGLPLRADDFGQTNIFWNSALITASTGFLAAVTATATNITGDVRGTYAVQTASDGTKTLQIVSRPSVINLAANVTTAMFGVAQA